MFEIIPIISHAIMITIFVLTMMLLVNYINVLTKGKNELRTDGKIVQGTRFEPGFTGKMK